MTKFTSLLCLLLLFILPGKPVSAQESAQGEHPAAGRFQLILPEEGTTVMAKRPLIKFVIAALSPSDTLLVIIDGTDVSNILEQKEGAYVFKPLAALPAGPHALQIYVTSPEGDEYSQEFHFNTRHTNLLEEVSSHNEFGLAYRHRVLETADSSSVPEWQVNSSLSSVSRVKEKYVDSSFAFNLRDIRQDEPIVEPEKAFNLADYLFKANFTHNDLQLHTEIGDVHIDESARTIQGLARRGGVFGMDFREYSLNSFYVKSKDVFGFTGGAGIGGSLDDSIVGVSAGGRLFSDRFKVKAIYATGGEENESYNEYEENTRRKGNIYGIVLGADLFQSIVQIEGEFAHSQLDADRSDEFSAEEDNAYSASVNGCYENYSLGISYEYYGPDFEVIGNPYGTRDLEIISAQSSIGFEINTINLSFSQSKDNVDKNDLYARNTTTSVSCDYRFTKFQNFQIGAHFDKNMLDSSNEPEVDTPVEMATDTYSGDICYKVWKLGITFNGSYSYQDDKAGSLDYDTGKMVKYDSASQTYSLTFDLAFDHVNFSPCFSFNTVEDKATEVDTDTYTATFALNGDIYWPELRYNLAGTYNRTESSDGLQKLRTFDTDFSLSYCNPNKLWLFESPTLAMEGRYGRLEDKALEDEDDEWTIFMKLTLALPVLL